MRGGVRIRGSTSEGPCLSSREAILPQKYTPAEVKHVGGGGEVEEPSHSHGITT